jgi:hypothetical protein
LVEEIPQEEIVEEDMSYLEHGGHPKIDYFDLLDYSTARTVRKDSQAAKYLSQNMLIEEGLLEEMLKAVFLPTTSLLTKHAMKSEEIVKKLMFVSITYLSCDLNHLNDVGKIKNIFFIHITFHFLSKLFFYFLFFIFYFLFFIFYYYFFFR